MRALAAAVATAVSLAACRVDVEGAPCDAPGATEVCPSGQACGVDGRCSERAMRCLDASQRCAPGIDTRCSGGNVVEVCVGSDPSCGAWQSSPCAGGLVCDESGHPAACECAAPGVELYVDASAGGSDATLVPTGAQLPAACRFGTIGAALERAVSGSTVKVVGPGASYPLPIVIPNGVALVAGDEPFAPRTRVFDDEITDGPAVVMEEGSRLAGFMIRTVLGGERPLALRVACGDVDKVTIDNVQILAAPDARLLAGIELTGGCDVDLLDVQITGVSGVGLDVGMASATPIVRMIGGRVELSQTGIRLTKGDLRLERTVIAENTGTGVLAGDGEGDTSLTATDAVFTGNQDTALALFLNARLDLQDNRICGNGATTQRGAAARKVGGVFFRAAPPLPGNLVFKRNEIHHNAADQIFVTGTTSSWNLSGAASGTECPADRNLLLGYEDDDKVGRGIVADAPVSARWNAWAGVTPTPAPLGQDYEALGTATIDAGAAGSQFCDPVPAPRPCP